MSDRRFCILLVEDDRALGPLAHGSLTHVGHRVTLAVSALEFYAYLSRPHKFDVVLLDLELGNDRSELVVARLHFEYVSLPPIVVFSALTIGELKRSVASTGAKGYVQKPASIEDIDRAMHLAVA